jgi:hypothetical protein
VNVDSVEESCWVEDDEDAGTAGGGMDDEEPFCLPLSALGPVGTFCSPAGGVGAAGFEL